MQVLHDMADYGNLSRCCKGFNRSRMAHKLDSFGALGGYFAAVV